MDDGSLSEKQSAEQDVKAHVTSEKADIAAQLTAGKDITLSPEDAARIR